MLPGVDSQVANDAISGNYSFGNIGMGNNQIANTSMLSQNYSASLRAGSFQQSDDSGYYSKLNSFWDGFSNSINTERKSTDISELKRITIFILLMCCVSNTIDAMSKEVVKPMLQK